MSFILNWAQDKAAGLLATGLQAGGTMAGNAVGGVGTLIESGGRAVGEGVNGSIRSVGGYIHGYGDNIIGSMAADGPVRQSSTVVRKTAIKSSAVRTGGAVKSGPPLTKVKSTPAPRRTLPASAKSVAPQLSDDKTRISAESRPRVKSTGRTASAPPGGNASVIRQPTKGLPTSSGKTRISLESRPRPRAIKA